MGTSLILFYLKDSSIYKYTYTVMTTELGFGDTVVTTELKSSYEHSAGSDSVCSWLGLRELDCEGHLCNCEQAGIERVCVTLLNGAGL